MQLTTVAACLAAFTTSAYAHIALVDPPPLRGATNPNVQNPDFDMVAPLLPDGSNFPCKGYHSDLGTPAGQSVITYEPGQTATFSLKGDEAAHNGGSCQISLSFDQGKTFKVIKSYIGNCVRSAGGNVFDANQVYDFTIPQDARAGDVLVSWSWFNQSGNREMYQNCVSATIAGSGTSTLDDRPDMFVANVNNGCGTTEGTDLEFPNPGNDVTRTPAHNGAPTGPPTGNCAAGNGTPAPAPAPEPAPAPAPEPAPAPVPEPDAGPAPPTTPNGTTHIVAAGEFCVNIAAALGITVEQIINLNPTVNAGCTNLQPGQVLNLRRRSRIMRSF